MTGRKRVDWDEEIRKTEKIKRKGMLMSAFSFAMAVAFILGISRSEGINIEISRSILFAVFFCVSCVIFRAIIRHRNKKHEENDA